MNIDELLRSETEKIEVPEELLPQNIAVMLKTRSDVSPRRKIQRKSSSVAFRAVTAVAACLALAAGFLVYSDKIKSPADLDSEIEYKDASRPDSYDDLYNIYTQIYLNGTPEENVTEYEVTDDITEESFADGLSEADLVRTENGAVYFINDGRLYKVTDGNVAVCADLGNKSPVDMYVENDRLILISENVPASDILQASDVPADDADTAGSGSSDPTGESDGMSESEGRTGVTAEIYDISDGVRLTESFTQGGRYVSSRVFGGNLSIVTIYSDYHIRPLGEESDLDNYVPYYELNGKRIYAAAEDIYVVAGAASTEYTVASSYNINGGAVSVKAILGSTGKVFCPGDTLYIADAGRRENEKPYTAISSFSLGSTIEYLAGGSVEGTLINGSLNEENGCLRAAAVNTMPDGTICTDIYVLDQSLSVINSAGQLLPGEKVSKVSFVGNYASLYTDSDNPELVLDLSQTPPGVAYDMMDSPSYSYKKFGDGLVLGIGKVSDEEGERVVMSMFDAASGGKYDSISFSESTAGGLGDIKRHSVLVVSESGIIGIPTVSTDEFGIHSKYFLFGYTSSNGFTEIGKVEYTDPDERGCFRRAVVSGGTIYIISDARIVSARTEDMKVIRVYEASE